MNLLREKLRLLPMAGYRIMENDAPDNSGINRAAEQNAALGREALDWYKQAYTDQAPARDRAAALAERVSLSQVEGMDTATRLAKEADTYSRTTFRPLEREVVQEARDFDTEAKREELAGLAAGDVQDAAATARGATVRDLTRMGVNPNDGAFGGGLRATENATTLALANAKTKARRDAMAIGDAKKMDAISLGRGLPSQQATQTQLALSSGNAAVGNAQVPVTQAQNATAQAGQGFNTAIQANNSSGNLYAQAAQVGRQDNGDALGGIANLAMAGKYIFSDKNMKTDRKPVKGKVALSAARKMPVDTWRYKKGSPGDDGGQPHVGPMAQDMRAAMGDEAAPGGKLMDAAAPGALALAAVKELDKGQKRLERKVVSLSNAINRTKDAS